MTRRLSTLPSSSKTSLILLSQTPSKHPCPPIPCLLNRHHFQLHLVQLQQVPLHVTPIPSLLPQTSLSISAHLVQLHHFLTMHAVDQAELRNRQQQKLLELLPLPHTYRPIYFDSTNPLIQLTIRLVMMHSPNSAFHKLSMRSIIFGLG